MCVPERRLTQPGTGDMLYWFHHSIPLVEKTRWPAVVRRHRMVYYVTDLPTTAVIAWFMLRYRAGVHRYLAGFTARKNAPRASQLRTWWCVWRFYFQRCGHMVHSHYTDIRL